MKIIGLLLFLIFISFLFVKLSKPKGPSRYDRKSSTPWNSLNDGEDPTL